MDLQTYLRLRRGNAVQLAHDLGNLNPVLVRGWGTRGVPIEHCAAVEMATRGQVDRRTLRPQDWWRIWPELVTPSDQLPEGALRLGRREVDPAAVAAGFPADVAGRRGGGPGRRSTDLVLVQTLGTKEGGR